MNKRFASAIAASTIVLSATIAQAALTLPLDPDHTSARFSVSHLTLTKVSGQIPVVKSEIVLDKDNVPTEIDATLDATKIDTQDESRDKDLRSEKWFDTAQYPTITYRSTKITRTSDTTFAVVGNLTMHGVTKAVPLTATYNGTAKGPDGHMHYGYSATGKLERDDFDIGKAPAAIVGNDIALNFEVEAVKK